MKMLIMGEKFAFGTAIGEARGALDFAYKRSGAQYGADMVSQMGTAGMLWRLAGARNAPLKPLMRKINPNWDKAVERLQSTGGMGQKE